MAAGQGFKTFTTGEVLTADDVNGYLMQGVLVFASAAARNAAITSPQEGQFAFTKDTNGLWYYDGAAWVASGATGDIEGVTAGNGLSGGGTSGTVTLAINTAVTADLTTAQTLTNKTLTSPALTTPTISTLTTNGDLLYGTGSGAITRRGIGSTGQVLTVTGGVPTWATPAASDSMVSLASGTYTGTALNITGLSTSYNKLVIQLSAFDPSGGSAILRMRFNNDATNQYLSTTDRTFSAYNFNASFLEQLTTAQHSTDSRFAFNMEIYNYATAQPFKQAQAQSLTVNPSNTADVNGNTTSNYYRSTSAISQVNIFESLGGTFSITYQIWGVK